MWSEALLLSPVHRGYGLRLHLNFIFFALFFPSIISQQFDLLRLVLLNPLLEFIVLLNMYCIVSYLGLLYCTVKCTVNAAEKVYAGILLNNATESPTVTVACCRALTATPIAPAAASTDTYNVVHIDASKVSQSPTFQLLKKNFCW